MVWLGSAFTLLQGDLVHIVELNLTGQPQCHVK
jgi:hypothetical protein